ncbi:anti-repressor SinI family protein, partial [Bacillus toyonensis]
HDETEKEARLDSEWTQLVKDAMNSGVSKEQFREFLEFTQWKKNQK